MHECHYKYILDTLWRPHYLPGDAQICDLLSSHFNNFSLDYFLEKKVWMLPMYSKTAPENSVLDAGGFAIAIGFRYSHGRGQGLGVLFPAQYDPSSITTTGANGRINEIAINLGANVSF